MEQYLVDWWLTKPNNLPFIIKKSGSINVTDGPDIHQCSLIIDQCLYQGNIEIDCTKSNWFKHNHFQNIHYQHLLLHLYDHEDYYDYTEGYIPMFSYCKNTNRLTKNNNILQLKQLRLQNLRNHFNDEMVFWLLFARTLGYYHNRDQMMYFAYHYISNHHKTIKLYGNSKSVRPNNRLSRRIKQFKYLIRREEFYQDTIGIIQNRLNSKDILKHLHLLINSYLPDGFKLDKNRIIQFISFSLLPLIDSQNPNYNENMFEYLKEIKKDFNTYSIIQKFI